MRQLVPAGAAQTDDRGEYRVWGLNPGEYYVSAIARNPRRPGRPRVRGAGGTGRARRLSSRGGVARSRPPTGPDDLAQEAYAPTYFPGVSSAGRGARGDDRSGG